MQSYYLGEQRKHMLLPNMEELTNIIIYVK